jgi:hypothetical protein
VRVIRPESLLNFFSRDDFTRTLEEKSQGLKRLILQLQSHAMLSQLSRSGI